VEAKKFLFTVVEGASVVRLEERRRNFEFPHGALFSFIICWVM
jgi:hypothetical protein